MTDPQLRKLSPAELPSSTQPSSVQNDQAAPSKGLSFAALILGIASIFFAWTLLVPVIGLVAGILALKREPDRRGMAITGLIISGVMLLSCVILFSWMFLSMVLGGAMGSE